MADSTADLRLRLQQGSKGIIVFIISDSSGETAEAVARAALVQFPTDAATIYRLPQVRSAEQLASLMRDISMTNGMIAYTLVLPEYRETLQAEAEKYQITAVDILGPLISRVAVITATVPLSQPGRLHLLDETYFKKIEAVDFAMRFDDGKQPEGIAQADVVLIGVSRTSKTPNCMYLAHHYGLKAANIPLVVSIEPPELLFRVPARKIVGLTIEPYLLQEIRITRAQVLGMPATNDYADLEQIKHEVKHAKKIFRQLKCHIIDVSAKAIEETSSEIFLHLRQ